MRGAWWKRGAEALDPSTRRKRRLPPLQLSSIRSQPLSSRLRPTSSLSRVKSGKVEGTSGLQLTSLEAEGVREELVTGARVTVGGVVIENEHPRASCDNSTSIDETSINSSSVDCSAAERSACSVALRDDSLADVRQRSRRPEDHHHHNLAHNCRTTVTLSCFRF